MTTLATVKFDWLPQGNKSWRPCLARCGRANLLQSWPHAVAARMHDQMMSRQAVIHCEGEPAGIMQIQEIRIGPLHMLRLHRGPLWFDEGGSPERWRAFWSAFAAAFPRRFGRWRHVLPEMDDSEETRQMLLECGFCPRTDEPYQTILLDLTPAEDEIRSRLKGKWRNALSQAERFGGEVELDRECFSTQSFLGGYQKDKGARGYRGAKPARLATMVKAAIPAGDVMIANALLKERTVAAMLFFRHGNTATYQAGWTSPTGRSCRAHHLLLWRMISELKALGVTALDLGGIHPRMAEGVTRFKQGLGGMPLTLPPIYG